jgi:Tfp pilus assembly protein PilF
MEVMGITWTRRSAVPCLGQHPKGMLPAAAAGKMTRLLQVETADKVLESGHSDIQHGNRKRAVHSDSTTRTGPVDWAVLALLISEALSLVFSQDRANSIGASEVVALSILVYVALRLLIPKPTWAAWLAAAIGLGGAWLALRGILQFAARARQLAAVGLTNVVAFRSGLMDPIRGWVPGECFTALLLVLPFACAATVYAWRKEWSATAFLALLPAATIVAALSLSLSRAAFWSTLVFFVAACTLMAVYRVVKLRIAAQLLAGCFGVLMLILACEAYVYPGVFRAYAGVQISQRRSTEGHIGVWTRSLELVRDHPLSGVGSSNAALWLLSSSGQEEAGEFASRTFSLPIQVLVENGVVGFGCYSAFLLLLGWEFHRGMRSNPSAAAAESVMPPGAGRRKTSRSSRNEQARIQTENTLRAMKCIFAAGLAAVLIRELVYSSLLEHTLTLAMVFALAALMCMPARAQSLKAEPVAIAAVLVVLAFQWPYWRYSRANSKLSDFYSQVASANFTAARDSIDEAIRLWPWNGRYYGWRAYVTSQELPSECLRRPHNEVLSLDNRDRQAAQDAAADYRHALQFNGRDAVSHQDLAWLEHLLGDDSTAALDWKESVEIDPDNAAFHVSYGMFLEERGSEDAAQAQFITAIEQKPSILDSPFFTRYRNRSPRAANSVVTEAIARLEGGLAGGNDPILEARLGKLYLFTGDASRAETLLTDAARQLPNLPLVWFNLGEVYEARGDDTRARTCYERARTIDPGLAGPYLRLGEMRLRAGDKEEAVHDLELAIARWQRINPVTSAHNNRLYDGPPQTIDDLLPTTLVWYISPCEASEAWTALSQIYPNNADYARRTSTCEELPAPHGGIQ